MYPASAPESSPRLTLFLRDRGDDFFCSAVLPSFSLEYQREIGKDAYELLVSTHEGREREIMEHLFRLGVSGATVIDGEQGLPSAVERARGDFVGFLSAPGVASPLLVATLLAAFDLHPRAAVVIPVFDIRTLEDAPGRPWFESDGWPRDGDVHLRRATLGLSGELHNRWLDPIAHPLNVVVPRDAAAAFARTDDDLVSRAGELGLQRVQIVGDGFVRRFSGTRTADPSSDASREVDPCLDYFGRVRFPPQESVARPVRFSERRKLRVSAVQVTYNMRRETPRTLQSLAPAYQRVHPEDYELIVVDNGSTAGLTREEIRGVAPWAEYIALEDAPRSPARALNRGAARASGDVLILLSDGASLLSPGMFQQTLLAFQAFPLPIVMAQYFYLGPGKQMETMLNGYDQAEEDRLLESIHWPEDGYRLFEISSPETLSGPEGSWLGGSFESDFVAMPRALFERIDGCDEAFDLPGGGLMVMDLLARAWAVPGAQPVKLLGEGVFHQFHGGITTGTTQEKLAEDVRNYIEQYVRLRGPIPNGLPKSFYFSGRLRTAATRAKMKD